MAAITFADLIASRGGVAPSTVAPEDLPKIRPGWNCRTDLREIDELAHRIAANPVGQHTPGAVRKGEGGYMYTVDGNRRLAAIRFINEHIETFSAMYPHIKGPLPFKAYVLTCNTEEAMEITLSAAVDRMELSVIDKAHALRDMENLGWDNKRIARALKCSPTYLSTLRDYLLLPAEAQQKLHDGVLTGDLASSLVGLPDSAIKETVERVASGAIKPAQAKREVNGRKREAGAKISRTAKDIRDELVPLAEEFMLASALSEYMAGNSRFSCLRDLIKAWDRGMREEEDEAS